MYNIIVSKRVRIFTLAPKYDRINCMVTWTRRMQHSNSRYYICVKFYVTNQNSENSPWKMYKNKDNSPKFETYQQTDSSQLSNNFKARPIFSSILYISYNLHSQNHCLL